MKLTNIYIRGGVKRPPPGRRAYERLPKETDDDAGESQ